MRIKFFFCVDIIQVIKRQYSVVAGKIDGKETVKQAAIREAKEEAGVNLKEDDVEVIGVVHRSAEGEHGEEYIDFFTVVEKWDGEIRNTEPHKCDDLRFF